MPAWPSTLPEFDAQGFQESAPDNLIRTAMDAGPDKVRRRFTAAPILIRVTLILDRDEFTAFKTFYRDELADGALSFTRAHPYQAGTVTFRFGEGRYTASGIAGGLYVSVSLDLELLP